MHGMIVSWSIGYQRVAFFATAKDEDKYGEGIITSGSEFHEGTITNYNAIYYDLLPYL